MLSLTREYRLLLRYGGNSLYLTHAKDLPPVPLAPFEFTILGRLRSLQPLAEHGYLLSNIKSVSVKTALKKCQQAPQVSANPSGVISAAQRALQPTRVRTPEELEAVARAASNPPWMPELVQSMLTHPDRPCRYIIVEDLLHPMSISRFHLIVKRQAVPQPQQAAAAAAAESEQSPLSLAPTVKIEGAATVKKESESESDSDSASSAPPQPQPSAPAVAAPILYRYWIKDLGSLNGLYIDGVKIAHQQWTLLKEGARLRFAPQTRNSKNYIASFLAADAVNEQRRRASAPGASFPLAIPALPLMPLSVKDMHLEYIFTSAMNDACKQRVDSLETGIPPPRRNEEQEDRPVVAGRWAPPGSNREEAAAAAAALPADYHQNSVAPPLPSNSQPSVNRKRAREEENDEDEQQEKGAAAAKPTTNQSSSSSSSAAAAAEPTTKRARMDTTTTNVFEELTCPICSDVIYQSAVLNCGHSFCNHCISKWFCKKNTCPVCRQVGTEITPNRVIDNIILILSAQHHTAKEKLARDDKIKAIKADAAEQVVRDAIRAREKAVRQVQRAQQARARVMARGVGAGAGVGAAADVYRAPGSGGGGMSADSEEDEDDIDEEGDDEDDGAEEDGGGVVRVRSVAISAAPAAAASAGAPSQPSVDRTNN